MMLLNRFWILTLLVTTWAGAVASAQGTGSVGNPVIKPGTSISAAGGLAIEDGSDEVAHRVDFRHAPTDRLRFNAIAFYNARDGDYRFRRLALEAMHKVASNANGWNSALQVRGFVPDGNDGPGRVRLAWLNRWRLESGPEYRLIGLASHEFGNERRDGLALETRGEVTWTIAPGTRGGAQVFNRYNRTSSLGSFNTQRHSIGGVLKGPLNDRMSYRVNALAGLSEAAADFELRVRLRLSL